MSASGRVHEIVRSPGRALHPAAQRFIESRLGHGFEGVRVHDDALASQSARALNVDFAPLPGVAAYRGQP